MNEVLKAIKDRYSCRDFTGNPITKEQMETLVEAALAAPSAINKQPWNIIMCTDKALIDELNDAGMEIISADEDKSTYNRIMERGGKMFYNAPGMLVALSDDSRWATMDCGILIENVALAAQSLGLGNVICAMMGIPLNGPKGDEFKKRLKFPEGYQFCIAILVGEAKSGKEPHELDKNKVIYV
ncbi:MAG: nitroreductase family protein [Defluviitaleaceae bacterium]|nr:nitroreductase family protein [Defluviitaleaceae bacterium]